ncbi:MAG: FimV/HubP family polar landmark protein [Nitrosomonadales bacterium]
MSLSKSLLKISNVATGAFKTIEVKHGDTLNKIAAETKSPEVSLERMLVAMYRANAEAFDGNNMNRLRTGKILRVPESEDLGKVTQVDAVSEIHAQAADWNAYRMKLAAASGSATEHAPKQESVGKIKTTVADKAPVTKESSKEVVRLSKGQSPGDKAASNGGSQSAQDKLHANEENAIARNKAIKESNERIALLEKNIKDMQHLIELKGQMAKTAPGKSPEADSKASPQPATTSGTPVAVQPVSAVNPAKPAESKLSLPWWTRFLNEPLYLGGGVVALLGLGGIGFMLARRRKKRTKG